MPDIPGLERRTKIVGTIGPATASETQFRALLERGMNVARLNFAHGEPAAHEAVLARIRELGAALDVPTAILQDLAGPVIPSRACAPDEARRRRATQLGATPRTLPQTPSRETR